MRHLRSIIKHGLGQRIRYVDEPEWRVDTIIDIHERIMTVQDEK